MLIFDYAIKVVVATLVVLGLGIVIIELSGVDMAVADEHEIFRYRMHAAAAVVSGYLLVDYLLNRRRARLAALAESTGIPQRPRRSYGAVFFALGLLVAGGAAFWHDHMTHDIPNPVAVTARFAGATCVDRGKRTGPYMAIAYEFPSQSARERPQEMKCFVDKCEGQNVPPQYMDTEHKRFFYASVEECRAALPSVLAAKAPATVWTGDKGTHETVRARFTPERDTPPYFLLWIPLLVALVVFVAGLVKMFRPRGD
ncbi:MAG: hypothetical protein EOO54_17040 [Haliea sp.]|nr:MAG: hypothetical protein EOO54_17040 [Haliea sp.]